MDYGNLKVPGNVTPEVQAILDSYQARNKEIENAHRKNMFRIGLGTVLSGASAHPVFNIPYVGTGLGGALYELGQGITGGDKLPELAKRTGQGFVIGETVGAIPYAGKYANKLSGGKIGNALTAGVEKLASTPLGQKVAEIAPKVEDLLMTDIKAFNPFKKTQTAYHGSPYDFAKFSNEAIGTGEGAQAHGYGHYAAKSKDVAEGYRRNLSKKDTPYEEYKTLTQYIDFLNGLKEKAGLSEGLENALQKSKTELSNLMNTYKPEEYLNNVNNGQLYKLSIPKDDVMLREDLPLSQQPNILNKLNFKNTADVEQEMTNLFEYIKNNKNILPREDLNNLRKQYADLSYKKMLNDSTLSGKDYYNTLVDSLGSENSASKFLADKGIKGISYNGGIDGEARVIFNPEDIEIVRKYYNQPSLYELIKKQKPFYGGVSNALYDYITGK